MIKVSVIVPIYNVEPYLRRSLNCLVNQTLKDIEIICINDCSPDNSLTILKEYAKKDNRIKIIDFKKNQGVSVARNSGMEIAKGEYMAFCDPDDYMDLDFCEKLYEVAKIKNADIAKTIRKRMDIDSNIELIEPLNEKIRKHKGYFSYQFQTAIYKSGMLKKHKVKFPPGIIVSQDCVFTVHAVIVAKNIYLLDNTVYHYVRRDCSGNSAAFNYQKACSYLQALSLMLNRVNKAMEKDKHYFCLYELLFQSIFKLLLKNSEKQTVKNVAETAIKYYQKCKFPKKLNLPKNIELSLKKGNKAEFIKELRFWKEEYNLYPEICINDTALQKCKLYIWGAGKDGVGAKKRCEGNGWKIAAFLDSHKNAEEFHGYKIKRPEQILKGKKDFFIIISSSVHGSGIAKICEQAGLKEGVDFWRPR